MIPRNSTSTLFLNGTEQLSLLNKITRTYFYTLHKQEDLKTNPITFISSYLPTPLTCSYNYAKKLFTSNGSSLKWDIKGYPKGLWPKTHVKGCSNAKSPTW